MNDYKNKLQWIYRYSCSFFPAIILLLLIGTSLSGINIGRALLMKNIVDSAVSRNIDLLTYSLILFGGLVLLDIALQGVTIFLSSRTYIKMQNHLEKNIYNHLVHSYWLKLSQYHSGDITTRISNDSTMVTAMVINTIPTVISSLVLLISSFIILFRIAPMLAIIGFVLSPLLLFLGKIYSRKLTKLYKETQETESSYRSFIFETIQNLIIVKAYCSEKIHLGKVKTFHQKKLKLNHEQNIINIFNNSLLSASSWSIFFITFIWGAFHLSSGAITFGTISILMQLFSNIQTPLSSLASSVPKAIATTASVDRLMELENLEKDDYYTENLISTSSKIHLNNLSFSYNGENQILNNVSVSFKPHEIIGIVGPSGQGKTTLIRLLLSLIKPDKGQITIDQNSGHYVLDASVRKFISYVPQGNTLFSGTIGDNLRYGNTHATIEELWSAVKIASIDDLIHDLPNGFDTIIGERGVGLSEGQAQRLSLARAIVKKAPILILDEATSALDMDTELKIIDSIHNLKHKPLCLVITHRPSALSICDRIFKLDHGRLLEISDDLRMSSVLKKA